MGLLLPLITLYFVLLTFLYLLLLIEKVLYDFFALNSFLLLICLLEGLGLWRLLVLKHAHVISEAIIQSSKWFAFSFLYWLRVLKRGPKIRFVVNKYRRYLALKRMLK